MQNVECYEIWCHVSSILSEKRAFASCYNNKTFKHCKRRATYKASSYVYLKHFHSKLQSVFYTATLCQQCSMKTQTNDINNWETVTIQHCTVSRAERAPQWTNTSNRWTNFQNKKLGGIIKNHLEKTKKKKKERIYRKNINQKKLYNNNSKSSVST